MPILAEYRVADDTDYLVTVEPGSIGGWFRVRCTFCSWSMQRSALDYAKLTASAHASCWECAGHCEYGCNECYGHCGNLCDECDGHCSADVCGYCEEAHCEQACDECDGHCEYDHANCEDCHYQSNGGYGSVVHDYSYKPAPIFHGDGKLFVGMELEVSWPDTDNAREWLDDHVNGSNFWYAKEDSSVSSGFELVTHPMTLDYGFKRFPYAALSDALHMGAEPDDRSCGTHLHISKAGLSGRQWWTLFAIHRKLPDLCGHVGGRGTNSEWARWNDAGSVLNDPIKAKLKPYDVRSYRYVPVNIKPDETVELRYPAGDFTPTGVRRNLQWVSALTTFGAERRCHDLDVSESAFIDHINAQDWPELQDRIATYA